MNQKHQQSIYHVNLNVNLMVENVIQIKSRITRKVKKYHVCEKGYIWNPATCSSKNGEYLASIIDNSVITCDEIIEETKTIPTNFKYKKKSSVKRKASIFYLPFINYHSIIHSCLVFTCD